MFHIRHHSASAQAVAVLLAALAGPAGAAISSSGAVNPDPSSGTVAGRLSIGSGNAGQVQVDGGSVLSTLQLGLGDGGTGNGSLVLSGAGTGLNVQGVNTGGLGNFDLGGWGTGSVSVLAGASFVHGVDTTDCLANCRSFFGNAAGSNGSLTVNGAGSSFSTRGRITVGLGSVFATATDGFDYGTAGAATQGHIGISAGGVMSAAQLTVGSAGGGRARTGAEQSFGSLAVEGAGSLLTLTRNSAYTGNVALLAIANGTNAIGVVDIKNGGTVRLDSGVAPTLFNGVNLGSGGATASGTLRIDGAGSLLELSGGIGFLNVGVNAAGSTGVLQITGGGRMAGTGDAGLPFANIGRDGATGTLTVSGNDAAGQASTLRLAGRNPVTDGGAFLNIGGLYNSGKPGTGTVNILGGGRIEIDTTSLVTNVPTARPGMYVGIGQGASGTLNIVGKSALTAAASTVIITGGTGVTPYVGVGQDGATGNVTVSGGGRWLISSTHASTTNANGDTLQLGIGNRNTGIDNPGPGASIGTVTVTGAGSEVALTGASDRYFSVGFGDGGIGTLNVSSGGVARSLSMLVGTGAGGTGAVNVNAARIELGGTGTSGSAAGTGGAFSVGRGGGTGTANFTNGAVLQIATTTANASINAGGTSPAPGGIGTINVLSGSQLVVSGPGATLRVGGASSATTAGIGSLNITGAGSGVHLAGAGARALIGAAADTIGTLTVGAGSTLSASSLIGVAHDGTNSTGGAGTLIVNGVAAAASVVNGTAGLIKGSGTLVGQVTNHGVINPGNSPGTLLIDGGFTNAAGGQLVLEVVTDGQGGFVTDHLVFTAASTVDLSSLNVEFRFLGDTNPNAFQASGSFVTDTFFKLRAADGHDSSLADGAFGGVLFAASSPAYAISNFSFSAAGGASFAAVPVPEPTVWALWLTGLAGLSVVRRRSAFHV